MKGKVLPCLIIKHHTMKTYGESRYSSTMFDLRTKWRQVVSFMPQLLYLWRMRLPYLLDKRLGVT
jgi:hypothetical protein